MDEAAPVPTPPLRQAQGERDDAPSREGRGRLSSIELLPEEAQPEIVWAMAQLNAREKPANMILAEFNARLADRGIAPISKSAWGRFSVRKALIWRRDREIGRLAELIAEDRGTAKSDAITVMIAEMTKLALFELLEGGDLSAAGLKNIGITLTALVNAQAKSAEARRKLDREVQERLDKAKAAIEAVGKTQGVDKETMGKITSLLTTGAA